MSKTLIGVYSNDSIQINSSNWQTLITLENCHMQSRSGPCPSWALYRRWTLRVILKATRTTFFCRHILHHKHIDLHQTILKQHRQRPNIHAKSLPTHFTITFTNFAHPPKPPMSSETTLLTLRNQTSLLNSTLYVQWFYDIFHLCGVALRTHVTHIKSSPDGEI